MLKTMNAVITSVSLGNEDHGLLSAVIRVEHEDGNQGFGGYMLYSPGRPQDKGNYAGLFIWRVMEIAGVHEWDDLVGKNIRVRADYSHIEAIGHIVKNKWFVPSKEMKALARKVGDDTDGD